MIGLARLEGLLRALLLMVVGTSVAILASAPLALALTRRDARHPVATTLHTE